MKTINQRELRNSSGEIMRGVRAGESYIVTVRGVPVATLAPISQRPQLNVARPATTRLNPHDIPRVTIDEPTSAILDDLRDGR